MRDPKIPRLSASGTALDGSPLTFSKYCGCSWTTFASHQELDEGQGNVALSSASERLAKRANNDLRLQFKLG
jgi:hypothetical protein